MFLEKQKPKTMAGISGNAMIAQQFMREINSWKPGKVILLAGPSGCGKSLALEIIASQMGYDLVKGEIEDLEMAATQKPIWSKGKILAFDADGAEQDGLEDLIERSMWPIIIITTDPYQRSLQSVRKDPGTSMITFNKIPWTDMSSILKNVCRENSIQLSDDKIYKLAKMADGDIRFALVALESITGHVGSFSSAQDFGEISRDPVQGIFEQLESVFQRAESTADEDIIPWLLENIPDRYSNPQQRAAAYRCLASGDRFRSLGLTSYSNEFIRLIPPSRLGPRRYKFPQWGAKK